MGWAKLLRLEGNAIERGMLPPYFHLRLAASIDIGENNYLLHISF